MAKLTLFGGVDEIGGNKILVEDGETRIFFDFGLSFAKGQYEMHYHIRTRVLGLVPRNKKVWVVGHIEDFQGLQYIEIV